MNAGWVIVLGLQSQLPTLHSTAEYPPVVEPVVQWRVDLTPDQDISTSVEYSAPALSRERVYVGVSHKSGIVVLNRHNGTVLETWPTQASVQSPPIIVNDTLIVSDISGRVYCFSLREGEQLWELNLRAPVNTKITREGERLYLSTNNDLVYSFSTDGELLWRFEHRVDPSRQGDLQLFGAAQPLVVNEEVVVGFSDGALVVLDRDSGSVKHQVWNGASRYPDIVSMATAIGDSYIVSAFEEPTWSQSESKVLWEQNYGGLHPSLPYTDGDAEYLTLHPGGDGVLRLIDTTTGNSLWEWDSETRSSLTRPVLLGDNILVGATNGTIFLVDVKTGQQVWELQEDFVLSGMMHAPVVDGDQIFLLTRAGFLLALQSVNNESYVCPDLYCSWVADE